MRFFMSFSSFVTLNSLLNNLRNVEEGLISGFDSKAFCISVGFSKKFVYLVDRGSELLFGR
jgi:hypothetical protein